MGYFLFFAIVIAGLGFARFGARAHTVAETETPFVAPDGALGNFLAVLNGVNSESDARYVSGLSALRKEKRTVLAEASRHLSSVKDSNFPLRHSIVLAVAAIRDPSALEFLSEVALNPQPLPPVDGPREGHGVNSVVLGIIVALDAIDGIEKLADDGNAAAIDVLVKATKVDSNSIRGAALTALAARGDRWEHLQRAMATLPFELHALAGLRRVSVRDVPQIKDPRAHLLGDGNLAAPAPVLRGDEGYQTRTPVPGAPQIRKG
jgi:hypothetical protein